MSTPLVYEVTLDIDAGAAAEFDAWLKAHVREMLALPGFRDARILRPESAEPGAERRVVQYTLAGRTELDRYLAEHAPRMRADGVQRFGDRLKASRRVLDLETDAPTPLLPGLALPPEGPRCRNCGTPLAGKFCVECGQKNHTFVAPLWHVLEEFASHHFGFDTKFFHSIVPLLFRPGFLTREYCLGHEERYIKPFRLYLFCSILFFFLAAVFWPQITELGSPQHPLHVPVHQLSPEKRAQERADLEKALRQLDAQPDSPGREFARSLLQDQLHKLDAPASAAAVAATGPSIQRDGLVQIDDSDLKSSGDSRFTRTLMNVREHPDEFRKKLQENLPKIMFVLMPLIALFLKIFYIGSRRYLTEHFVFTLHFHSMAFLVMLVLMLLGAAGKHFAWMAPVASQAATVAWWYIAIYGFLALRFFYRQSWAMTLLKFCLLFVSYFVALALAFVFGVLLTVAES